MSFLCNTCYEDIKKSLTDPEAMTGYEGEDLEGEAEDTVLSMAEDELQPEDYYDHSCTSPNDVCKCRCKFWLA